MEKDIIEPIKIFHENINTVFHDSIKEFKGVKNSFLDRKMHLESVRQRYLDACLEFEKEEKAILLQPSQFGRSSYQSNEAQNKMLVLKSKMDTYMESYKYEINVFNRANEENNVRYMKAIEMYKSNEESRIYFIKCILEKFYRIDLEINNFHKELNDVFL